MLSPGISDHSPLLVKDCTHSMGAPRSRLFKFMNYIVKEASFLTTVQQSWSAPVVGTAMFCLWKKLQRLQPNLRTLQRKYTDLDRQIEIVRTQLTDLQAQLTGDRFNGGLILEVKSCIEKLMDLLQTEEEILAQKAKIDWITLGDGNNTYFHASLKEKHKTKNIYVLENGVGQMLYTHQEIEAEIVGF